MLIYRLIRQWWRQRRLDYHHKQQRRLMGLPPQSPWKSMIAAEHDWPNSACNPHNQPTKSISERL